MRAASRTGEAGFTLVETLVAIAVVAAVSVALQRGFVSTRQALARAEAVTAAEAVARDILENRLDALAAGVGTARGEEAGLAYEVVSEPLDLPFPPPPAPAPARTAPAPRPEPPQDDGGPPPRDRPAAAAAGESEAPPEDIGRWVPLRVTIRVEPASGPPLVVETVHAAPAP